MNLIQLILGLREIPRNYRNMDSAVWGQASFCNARYNTNLEYTIELGFSITAEEGEKLQELIIEKRPNVSFEVGLGYGISELFIVRRCPKFGASATL